MGGTTLEAYITTSQSKAVLCCGKCTIALGNRASNWICMFFCYLFTWKCFSFCFSYGIGRRDLVRI